MKREKRMPAILALLFTLFLTGSAVLIYYLPERNNYFLIFYGALYIMLFAFRKRFPAAMVNYCRTLLGLLFIYSGFVKGVDPLGTMYKVEDYYIAYGSIWAMPLAIYQSFAMNAVEFVLGVALLLKLKPKLITILTTLMMAVFTFTTYMDAMYNIVPDCGCFGESLILSNWQTFYKNLTINGFLLVLLFSMKRTSPFFFPKVEWNMMLVSALLFLGFEYYNYSYLPVVDFRAYKVGNRLIPENPEPVEYFLSYRNTQHDSVAEYRAEELPWDDEEWMSKWEFVSQRVYDPNKGKGADLAFEDLEGNDVTAGYIENPDPQFFLISWTLAEFNEKKLDDIMQFVDSCNVHGVGFVLVTASDADSIEAFREKSGFNEEVLRADDIELKTVIRSNPGLVLLQDATVIEKWHWRNFPQYSKAKKLFINQQPTTNNQQLTTNN
jgi:uncharacterized membrane protein YphA (DoxX/SURF4 family)